MQPSSPFRFPIFGRPWEEKAEGSHYEVTSFSRQACNDGLKPPSSLPPPAHVLKSTLGGRIAKHALAG